MSRARGLTLIEVLVAVVLCGAGLAVASLGIAASIRADAHADDLARAADGLEHLLARLESGELPLEESAGVLEGQGESWGTSEPGAPQLQWELALSPTDVEGLQEARLTVFWARQGAEHDLSATRWVFVDPLSGGVQ